MATELMYLEDFDVTTCDATVQTITTDGDRTTVTLDRTSFYPRGGGQDWDEGTITGSNGIFKVHEVRLDEDGIVRHIGEFQSGALKAGDAVKCEVDKIRRNINTQLHSGGHLLSMAIAQLHWPWTPEKGAHFPHMSFVEYDAPGFEITEQTTKELQAKLDELIKNGSYENKILFLPVAEMDKYCPYVPENIPTNKPSRVVLFADDFGMPCGGTHVRHVSDLGRVHVAKIKAKNGVIKISYTVEGAN